MKKKHKDLIAIISAIVLLAFGIGLSIAGFIVDPLGIVDSSILWIFGQCCLYAGSIFGIGMYVKGKMDEVREDVNQFINGKR